MQMASVGVEEAAWPSSPADDRARGVDDRDRQQEQGGDHRKATVSTEAAHTQGSEGKAEEVGAVVPEIKHCRWGIPGEQADLGGRERQRGEGEGATGTPKDEACGRQSAEAEGEAIQAVNEIEGDGRAQDPQGGEGDRSRTEGESSSAGEDHTLAAQSEARGAERKPSEEDHTEAWRAVGEVVVQSNDPSACGEAEEGKKLPPQLTSDTQGDAPGRQERSAAGAGYRPAQLIDLSAIHQVSPPPEEGGESSTEQARDQGDAAEEEQVGVEFTQGDQLQSARILTASGPLRTFRRPALAVFP